MAVPSSSNGGGSSGSSSSRRISIMSGDGGSSRNGTNVRCTTTTTTAAAAAAAAAETATTIITHTTGSSGTAKQKQHRRLFPVWNTTRIPKQQRILPSLSLSSVSVPSNGNHRFRMMHRMMVIVAAMVLMVYLLLLLQYNNTTTSFSMLMMMTTSSSSNSYNVIPCSSSSSSNSSSSHRPYNVSAAMSELLLLNSGYTINSQQLQHIVDLHQSYSSNTNNDNNNSNNNNILIWLGTQYNKTMLERIVQFWNTVVTKTTNGDGNNNGNGPIVVFLIESINDFTDQPLQPPGNVRMTVTQSYYNSLHRIYPHIYCHATKFTTNSNNVMKQFHYYYQYPTVWEKHLSLIPYLPEIVTSTSMFSIIIIDGPGMYTTEGDRVQRRKPNTAFAEPVAGPFQSIYTTQQLIHSTFQAVRQFPIHVFVVMDPTQDSLLPQQQVQENDEEEEEEQRLPINIEEKFANRVFHRTPIRIIPSSSSSTISTTASTKVTTSSATSDDRYYDVGQYLFYYNDPILLGISYDTNDEEQIRDMTAIQQQQQLMATIVKLRRQQQQQSDTTKLPKLASTTTTTSIVTSATTTTTTTSNSVSLSSTTMEEPIAIHSYRDASIVKPIMAIITSTRSFSRDIIHGNVKRSFVYKYLVSSINRTVTNVEVQYWTIHLYIAVDEDDVYWDQHWKDLQTNDLPEWLQIFFVTYPDRTNGRIPFNEIARTAYDHSYADYYCRVNDDTEFITSNWITEGVSMLAQQHDPPNIGVVGPHCEDGKQSIMTHDMVHRTHLEIFHGFYYPIVFRNKYVDDWITNVYSSYILGIDRSTKIYTWVVQHHASVTRYLHNNSDKLLLPPEYERGKQFIYNYLLVHYPNHTSVLEAIQGSTLQTPPSDE